MRDYKEEFTQRVSFIQKILHESGAEGIVYGNSGGKDSTLVGILCKAACSNTVGLIMPCSSKQNYHEDMEDAQLAAAQYGIETCQIDLARVKDAALYQLKKITTVSDNAAVNIAPRLRMMTLYAFAASENRLVAGTGNRSEEYVGYFTKWGDGAYDFNPIADLTATEVYEFLQFLNAPVQIIEKAPSAALFDGQTDEKEMGFSYYELDRYLSGGLISAETTKQIEEMHIKSNHKRLGGRKYFRK